MSNEAENADKIEIMEAADRCKSATAARKSLEGTIELVVLTMQKAEEMLSVARKNERDAYNDLHKIINGAA